MTHDRDPKTTSELFIRQSLNRLRHDYLPKIRRCLDDLDEGQIWWRPHATSNSVGNLVVHLAGNIRQWMVHGLGGAEDRRERDAEFSRTEGFDADALFAQLDEAVTEAEAVIKNLSDEALHDSHVIQGYQNTGLSAVYHVVEHFAGHTGQIIWITKMLSERDLGFYRH